MAREVIVYAYLYGYEDLGLSKTIRVTADDDIDDDVLLDAVVEEYIDRFFENVDAQADIVDGNSDFDNVSIDLDIKIVGAGGNL
tara:strand:+ start:77 stop:328 length:252 start_codon:yes stop_codon:yes gene_type:complete